ncbi:putative cyclin-dependent serine/threonine-protein kinase DDB_G0272797/DDB_G0274007 [Anastrepha ludens]|uniref:putative cyclin-dependent serine/threonine-protein kinase DDB_G0272797/DDB_G0274007 n=1 Tax=Anastrepha ludens TaxID=28586 RepID=UPI0023AFDC92|nr:putative cyclin-dependent serine/threonine-protein kinase DDB_G0272797/DDB_G0274007 [Anastrepha ludens]
MTAVRWECAWWYSIVLVFLLVRHSAALNVTTEEPYFLDEKNNQGERALTTRFYTSGDVDETFWLKHLGDDFKNAILLQVDGEERSNGENGSAYKTQEESRNNPVRENEVQLSETYDETLEENNKKKVKGDNNKARKSRRRPSPEQNIEKPERSKNATKMEMGQNAQNATSDQFYSSNDQRSYEEALKNMQYQEKLEKYTRDQNINLKNTPDNSNVAIKTNNALDNSTLTIEGTPVVVSLPESSKLLELETNDTPVVLPSMIYHSDHTHMADQGRQYTDNTHTQTQANTRTEIGTLTMQHEPVEGKTHLDERVTSTQYTQRSYAPMTYEHQQHYQQHAQHTQNQEHTQQHFQHTQNQQPPQHLQHTDFHQQEQAQYPVQMQNTQYQQAQLYDQPIQQQQQQHQNQEYSSPYVSPNYYNSISASHHNQGDYPAAISEVPIHQPNTLEDNNIDKFSYMLSKRSPALEAAAPRAENGVPQAQPDSINPEYNRVSLSNRELYQEGL